MPKDDTASETKHSPPSGLAWEVETDELAVPSRTVRVKALVKEFFAMTLGKPQSLHPQCAIPPPFDDTR
jgi:hypothetical protein